MVCFYLLIIIVTGENVNANLYKIFLTGGKDGRWKDDIVIYII